eukprot:2317668-Rhodomonas_salina.1
MMALNASFPGTQTHSIADTNMTTDQPVVATKYGKRPHTGMKSTYKNPTTNLKQQLISEFTVQPIQDSWLKTEVTQSKEPITVACTTIPCPREPTIHYTDTSHTKAVHLWKGVATGKNGEGVTFTMEQAKAAQWQARDKQTWAELSTAAITHTETANASEEAGYRTWSWDLLDRL